MAHLIIDFYKLFFVKELLRAIMILIKCQDLAKRINLFFNKNYNGFPKVHGYFWMISQIINARR